MAEAETVDSVATGPEAPRRRGRPKGARDTQPRKRRNDGTVGQVLDAVAPQAPKPPAPKPASRPKTPSQLPLSAAPAAPPAADSDSTGIPPESLDDVRRKLKFEADIKEEQAKKFARENAVAAGRLRPAEEFDAMLAKRAALLARSLLSLPDRISDELALESDPRRIRVRLRSELEGLLRTYAGQSAQAAAPIAPVPAAEAEA